MEKAEEKMIRARVFDPLLCRKRQKSFRFVLNIKWELGSESVSHLGILRNFGKIEALRILFPGTEVPSKIELFSSR